MFWKRPDCCNWTLVLSLGKCITHEECNACFVFDSVRIPLTSFQEAMKQISGKVLLDVFSFFFFLMSSSWNGFFYPFPPRIWKANASQKLGAVSSSVPVRLGAAPLLRRHSRHFNSRKLLCNFMRFLNSFFNSFLQFKSLRNIYNFSVSTFFLFFKRWWK